MNKPLIILIICVLAAIGLLAYFLIYVPSNAIPDIMEGSPCKINNGPGIIRNGHCIPNPKEVEERPN